MAPSPTVAHESRAVAWQKLWQALLAPLPDEDSNPQNEPAENDEEAAQAAAEQNARPGTPFPGRAFLEQRRMNTRSIPYDDPAFDERDRLLSSAVDALTVAIEAGSDPRLCRARDLIVAVATGAAFPTRADIRQRSTADLCRLAMAWAEASPAERREYIRRRLPAIGPVVGILRGRECHAAQGEGYDPRSLEGLVERGGR